MTIRPILTEKSLGEASNSRYTFRVPKTLTKHEIKLLVNDTFGVTVKSVQTANSKNHTRRGVNGKIKTTKASKKAIVTLKEGDKIDLFAEEKK